jgi:hypothetical protein
MKQKILLTALLTAFCAITQAQTNSNPNDNDEILSESKYKPETKKNVVKLYSKKEKGTVIITSHRQQDVQIYIFDLEGTIMHQGILRNKEKTKISSLEKGVYTYTIFANDESVEEGKLIIK